MTNQHDGGSSNRDGTLTTAYAPFPVYEDSMIVSGNRFADIEPYCTSIYNIDPKKWGTILPWEFPQHATRTTEETFLRKYFNDREIHLQGGACIDQEGGGAGFRFLKQVWYTIAIWNFEQRIPSIARWWLEQHEEIVSDALMLEQICSKGAKIQACFTSEEIALYGTKILDIAFRCIQDSAHARLMQLSGKSKAADDHSGTNEPLPTDLATRQTTQLPQSSLNVAPEQLDELKRDSAVEALAPIATGTPDKHSGDGTTSMSAHHSSASSMSKTSNLRKTEVPRLAQLAATNQDSTENQHPRTYLDLAWRQPASGPQSSRNHMPAAHYNQHYNATQADRHVSGSQLTRTFEQSGRLASNQHDMSSAPYNGYLGNKNGRGGRRGSTGYRGSRGSHSNLPSRHASSAIESGRPEWNFEQSSSYQFAPRSSMNDTSAFLPHQLQQQIPPTQYQQYHQYAMQPHGSPELVRITPQLSSQEEQYQEGTSNLVGRYYIGDNRQDVKDLVIITEPGISTDVVKQFLMDKLQLPHVRVDAPIEPDQHGALLMFVHLPTSDHVRQALALQGSEIDGHLLRFEVARCHWRPPYRKHQNHHGSGMQPQISQPNFGPPTQRELERVDGSWTSVTHPYEDRNAFNHEMIPALTPVSRVVSGAQTRPLPVQDARILLSQRNTMSYDSVVVDIPAVSQPVEQSLKANKKGKRKYKSRRESTDDTAVDKSLHSPYSNASRDTMPAKHLSSAISTTGPSDSSRTEPQSSGRKDGNKNKKSYREISTKSHASDPDKSSQSDAESHNAQPASSNHAGHSLTTNKQADRSSDESTICEPIPAEDKSQDVQGTVEKRYSSSSPTLEAVAEDSQQCIPVPMASSLDVDVSDEMAIGRKSANAGTGAEAAEPEQNAPTSVETEQTAAPTLDQDREFDAPHASKVAGKPVDQTTSLDIESLLMSGSSLNDPVTVLTAGDTPRTTSVLELADPAVGQSLQNHIKPIQASTCAAQSLQQESMPVQPNDLQRTPHTDITASPTQQTSGKPTNIVVAIRNISESSMPETPASAYTTAPPTPVVAEMAVTKAKPVDKPKGPSQTESLSMFGKKPQKSKKKDAKDRNTLKEKPKELMETIEPKGDTTVEQPKPSPAPPKPKKEGKTAKSKLKAQKAAVAKVKQTKQVSANNPEIVQTDTQELESTPKKTKPGVVSSLFNLFGRTSSFTSQTEAPAELPTLPSSVDGSTIADEPTLACEEAVVHDALVGLPDDNVVPAPLNEVFNRTKAITGKESVTSHITTTEPDKSRVGRSQALTADDEHVAIADKLLTLLKRDKSKDDDERSDSSRTVSAGSGCSTKGSPSKLAARFQKKDSHLIEAPRPRNARKRRVVRSTPDTSVEEHVSSPDDMTVQNDYDMTIDTPSETSTADTGQATNLSLSITLEDAPAMIRTAEATAGGLGQVFLVYTARDDRNIEEHPDTAVFVFAQPEWPEPTAQPEVMGRILEGNFDDDNSNDLGAEIEHDE